MAGHHTIYLGMAPGVGKTFRMLAEGHAARDDGRDVVVGVVETHGRRDTELAIGELEVFPRRELTHRGARLSEMDLPGLLARVPELCLVDELAHTNAPGLEHPKRHEDVAGLLGAGIDVLSTMNVQHLESLNDRVAELTGVRVRETVPDAILTAADQVLLVDLTPEGLLTRLREGKVYPQARIASSLQGFFKIENLQALREVALREVAEEVESKRLVRDDLQLREERLLGGSDPQAISERLMAVVGLDETDERIVRRAWRSSQRLSADLDVLVVRPPDRTPSAVERGRIEALRRLSSALGAHFLVEDGADVAETVARAARERASTYLLIGPPERRRGLGRLNEPLVLALTRLLPDVDVRIVADRRPQESQR